jgi:two-component system, cell cycle sensor histidine kinase and response regulator CckA
MPYSVTGTPPPRGSETILLVEPEPETRTLAAFMLAKLGYRILEARNAAEAVKLHEEHGPAVDLLFTEALMSKVNGHELAQILSTRNPALRVLYLSDVDYARLTRRIAVQKGLAFLPRPFTMSVLAGKVREVLDAPKQVASVG